jgi:ribonuclease HII
VAILAGIDEAGFGPILGPLVVTGVSFRIPDDQLDACLWETLRESCSRLPARAVHRLVITDSKQLYKSRSHLPAIERPALVMLGVRGCRPVKWLELLEHVWPGGAADLLEYAWYAKANFAIPVAEDTGDIVTRANAVRRNCEQKNVSLLEVFAQPLPEGQYNRLVRRTRNKSTALMGLVLRVVDHIVMSAGEERARILVDRLGGRLRYREHLMNAFPGYEMAILEETKARSAYRLRDAGRFFEIEFVTGGDREHLPVALASIYSKYLRELFMGLFNGFWCKQIKGLTPTAGYYLDAHRWLREARPAIDRLGIDRSLLVRER